MEMKHLFLITLLIIPTFCAMGQSTITRNKPHPQQKTKMQSKPQSQPEEVGYDVSFSCNLPTAFLFIDGEENGYASGSRFLKTGEHSIKIIADGYEDFSGHITVNRQNNFCEVSLVKINFSEDDFFQVHFACNIPSASLYIDSNLQGSADGSYALKEGIYQMKVVANGYEDYKEQITIAQSDQSFSVVLVKERNTNDTIFKVKDVEFVMVYVQGGSFSMGATSEQEQVAQNNERPIHEVTLDDFYIGQTEVTQALWVSVMGSNPSRFKDDNLPVENVSWDDCQEFLRKLNQLTGLNFRMPTEAEWEYAARGGKANRGYLYAGSSTIDDVAWYSDNSSIHTHRVDTKIPNELGLYDMSGNVWEWCQDWYGDYSSSSQSNPQGPDSGTARVLRGGSWDFNAWYSRVSCRFNFSPSFRINNFGLRLVLP